MKKYRKPAGLILLVLFVVWLGVGFYVSRYSLLLTTYQIHSDQIKAPLRIVQLSDLHCTKHGQELSDLVAAQEPDLIAFVGDLVNMDEQDISVAVDTLRNLTAIAPVYVSMGNHETAYESTFDVVLKDVFTETGATVLGSEYEDIEVNGQTIRIGGIYGYCLPEGYWETQETESRFLHQFQSTSHYTLLLAHMPVCWLINGSLEYWDVDCVLSGHAHGGQVVLPFVGGLYAPDQGWFPGDVQGHFERDGKHLIVTSGLGGNTPVPRFYNRPEVVVIDLLPEQS